MGLSAKQVVEALRGEPVSVGLAISAPEQGGVPDANGFYAWWIKRGSLPGGPEAPHPTRDDLDLLYVGISPSSATSGQTLRSRILNHHIGGNTGSSTFRFTLAALLMEAEGFRPLATKTKVVLSPADNAALSRWQKENLFLTWCKHPTPWQIEGAVIAAMQPPLNLAGNSSHPFYAILRAARAAFRAAARS